MKPDQKFQLGSWVQCNDPFTDFQNLKQNMILRGVDPNGNPVEIITEIGHSVKAAGYNNATQTVAIDTGGQWHLRVDLITDETIPLEALSSFRLPQRQY
jgi:hypothetical protein